MNPDLFPIFVAGIVVGGSLVVTGYVLTIILTGWLRDRRKRDHLHINRIIRPQ